MVFIPFSDDNPRVWIRYHYATLALVAACVLIFLWQADLSAAAGRAAVYGLGLIPAVLWDRASLSPDLAILPAWATLATSLFLHGGWLHLIGNMLFLWTFGDNVEDAMGHRRFVVFYLLCGAAAGLAHAWSAPDSDIPTIGASGAVAGVLGAYFVLHPRVGIWGLLFWIVPIRLPTALVLGSWVGLDLLNGLLDQHGGGGVAWWAHVGGFAAGALAIPFFKRPHVPLWDRAPGARIRQPIRLRRRDGPWGRR